MLSLLMEKLSFLLKKKKLSEKIKDIESELGNNLHQIIVLLFEKTEKNEIDWEMEGPKSGLYGLRGYTYRATVNNQAIEIDTAIKRGCFLGSIDKPRFTEELTNDSSPSAKLLRKLTEKIRAEKLEVRSVVDSF